MVSLQSGGYGKAACLGQAVTRLSCLDWSLQVCTARVHRKRTNNGVVMELHFGYRSAAVLGLRYTKKYSWHDLGARLRVERP